MKKQIAIASCVLMLMASSAAAQSGSGSGKGAGAGAGATAGSGSGSKEEQTTTSGASQYRTPAKDGTKTEEGQQPGPRFVRTLTNVQIEVTLTDQVGGQAPEKKTVSMLASSGNWGKIRSAGSVLVIGQAPYTVELNVDARPFVSVDGLIQLEMTLVYAPLKGTGDVEEGMRRRPSVSGINQSQTIVLHSGKPQIVSQAADPISDRKVVVEVKATVLK